jgi:hypothetical protein
MRDMAKPLIPLDPDGICDDFQAPQQKRERGATDECKSLIETQWLGRPAWILQLLSASRTAWA